jgi:Cu+-exporting ATPase
MSGNETITEPAASLRKPGPVTELLVSGMTCGNCARHVTDAIQGVSGVCSASVSLDARTASIRWEASERENVTAVVEAVKRAGFAAEAANPSASHDHTPAKFGGWELNLWLGVVVTAALMAGDWVFGLGMNRWFQWLTFFLAAIVQVVAGAPFYRGAWAQAKVRSSNMDTLVALGSTTAFAYSTWALFSGAGGHLYFMEAAAIITLISVGHWMEARVSRKASSALRALMELAPDVARKVNGDGKEVEAPVGSLRSGDIIAVRPGDRISVDGVVVEGHSAVNESMLTGESVPVEKGQSNEIYTGTMNINGRLLVRVTATGEGTALANIIAAVQRAQTSRASIQRLGDRVSNVFVPVVVLIAVGAGLWWGLDGEHARQVSHWLSQYLWAAHPPEASIAAGFIIAAAVLIVACPCAMGLATPAAIMAGSNAAAKNGILIRDGVALEKAGQVTAVVFDKTGTLTNGKFKVERGWMSGRSEFGLDDRTKLDGKSREFLDLAASLARPSSHPVSRAISELSAEKIGLRGWSEVRGSGVQAVGEAGEDLIRLGSLGYLRESGIRLTEGEKVIDGWSKQGVTMVGVARGNALIGLFAARDTLKQDAAKVVEELERQGLKIFMITGDNAVTAQGIAQEAGIPPERVFAGVRPEQKASHVKQLQSQGERVAFVGDGINDSPALEQADLGIAVSRASDVAREAADIVLLKSEIGAVPQSLGLARATLRTIKQNLFWAFFYNCVGIPLAALGFLNPALCAAAMGFSDLIVIGNALRLRSWQSAAVTGVTESAGQNSKING